MVRMTRAQVATGTTLGGSQNSGSHNATTRMSRENTHSMRPQMSMALASKGVPSSVEVLKTQPLSGQGLPLGQVAVDKPGHNLDEIDWNDDELSDPSSGRLARALLPKLSSRRWRNLVWRLAPTQTPQTRARSVITEGT